MKLENLNLANTHLVSILFSLIFIIFFFKAIFLKFLLTALVFQIYLRVLNFSFAYIQAFSRNLHSQSISNQETNTQNADSEMSLANSNTQLPSEMINSVVTLKTIGSLSRAIFSAFLLFLLVKYFSIGTSEILLAISGLIISFITYGYISSRK